MTAIAAAPDEHPDDGTPTPLAGQASDTSDAPIVAQRGSYAPRRRIARGIQLPEPFQPIEERPSFVRGWKNLCGPWHGYATAWDFDSTNTEKEN